MVIKLCFVQFGLKSRACFQNLNVMSTSLNWYRQYDFRPKLQVDMILYH